MALYLSMCNGCTRQHAVQGAPSGCEMPGDNGYTCPACQARQPQPAIVPGRSYFLRDGWPRTAKWVVLRLLPGALAEIRRLGFPNSPVLTMPVYELSGGA